MPGLHFFNYMNLALAGLHIVLTCAHYVRIRNRRCPALCAGAVLYFLVWFFRAAPQELAPGSLATMPLESLAIIAWFAGFVWYDDVGRRVAQWLVVAVVSVCLIIVAVSGMGLIAPPGEEFMKPPAFVLLLFFIAYVLYVKLPDRHYYVQAMVFLLLATGLSMAAAPVGPGRAGIAVMVFMYTAYGAAFISMILLTDVMTVSEIACGIEEKSLNSTVYEVTDYVVEGMQRIRDDAGRECTKNEKLELIVAAIGEVLGYGKVFQGRWEDAGHRLRFDYEPGGDAPRMVKAAVVVPELLVAELRADAEPLLIEDAAGDSRIGDPTLTRFDLNSFVLLPLSRDGDVSDVLLIGDRRDGGGMSEADLDILWRVAGHITTIFAGGSARSDATSEQDIDTVTSLRNFSSFQKLLSKEIQKADKNGACFALFLFDTDRFSAVNEKLGYERGDIILKEIGERLVEHAAREYVGRVGADEFAVLIPDAPGDIRALAERILADINESLTQICEEVPMTMSAAYSLYPYDFFEQTGVFGKMREMLSGGGSTTGHIVRVKLG